MSITLYNNFGEYIVLLLDEHSDGKVSPSDKNTVAIYEKHFISEK